jgi:hypothetical protein
LKGGDGGQGMQIAFLTLFLGLIAGPHTVALSAGSEVASIELLLDGARVALLTGPPWTGRVDLGREPLPHRLVARARDVRGGEVAQAEQWINLPRPPAEVEILVEKAVAGQPRTVRVVWQSLTHARPTSVALSLDGRPLALDGQHRAELPPHPPDSATRVLSAELSFPDGLEARRDVALGREYGDEVSTELTAVPVWWRGLDELPAAAGLQGWFTDGGRPLRVDAVEAGTAQVWVVRDPAVARFAKRMGWHPWAMAPQRSLALGHRAELRFLSSTGRTFAGEGLDSELFDRSPGYPFSEEYETASLLARLSNRNERIGAPQKLTDAVAVAGLQACATGRPRAVLLVVAPGAKDVSRYAPAAVRRYLAALHVPLFVWSADVPDRQLKAAWGTVEEFTTRDGLDRGFRALARELETQRIVWVEGRHLPQSIALAPAASHDILLDPAP